MQGGRDERLDAAGFAPPASPRIGESTLTARDGSVYRLLLALPEAPAPARGYPLLVLVDGDALFATAVQTARLQAARPSVTGLDPAAILGIGYPGRAPFDSERRQRDLLPVPGGAERFAATIAAEILPLVESVVPLDPARRGLVGHSYGGLFVLHTLFTRPGLFASHVAGSPSIWWSDRAILRSEETFRNGRGGEAGRLLITVGEREQGSGPWLDPQRAERAAMARMRDNAAEMAARLAASGRVACEFTLFPDENHVSVIPAMLSRAVAFALAGTARRGAAAA